MVGTCLRIGYMKGMFRHVVGSAVLIATVGNCYLAPNSHVLVLEQEIRAKRVSIVLRAGAVTGLLSSLTSLHFRV